MISLVVVAMTLSTAVEAQREPVPSCSQGYQLFVSQKGVQTCVYTEQECKPVRRKPECPKGFYFTGQECKPKNPNAPRLFSTGYCLDGYALFESHQGEKTCVFTGQEKPNLQTPTCPPGWVFQKPDKCVKIA